MIRNMKIFLIVVSVLSLQQAYAAGEAEGDQHENEEAEHAGEENQSRQIHLTPEQTELLSIQTGARWRNCHGTCRDSVCAGPRGRGWSAAGGKTDRVGG